MQQSRWSLASAVIPFLLLSCGNSPPAPTPPSKAAAVSAAITSTAANNDASSVTYTVTYTGSHQYFRVYVDTDRAAGTGFQYAGVGAEFLIENTNLYRYTGSGTDWSWTAAGTVTFSNAGGQATWTVSRSALGETDPCASAANLVFDIDDGTAPIVQQALTPAASCATAKAAPTTLVATAVTPAAGNGISGARAANDASTVQYAFAFTGAPAYWRVYVDTDGSGTTGFPTNGGVGAEYLLEGSGVYRYVGPGWNWTSVGSATFSTTGGTASWSVARALLGETAACGETSTLLFQTEDSAGTMISAGPLAQTFTNAGSCTSAGTGGTTASPATATGGTSASPATATGGTSAPPATATGGTSAPPATATGGTSAPPTTATGGTTASPATATGGTSASPATATGGTSTSPATATGGTSGTSAAHTQVVFVITMENEAESAVYGSSSAPYINKQLIPQYAHATAFTDPLPDSIPSEPHYVWMEAGTNAFSDTTFTTDADPDARNSTASTAHLTTQMMAASPAVSWLSFMEGLDASTTGACPVSSSGFYGAKHDPFVFFQDIAGKTPSPTASLCVAHHRAYTTSSFAQALSQGTVAQYNFITPNLCNDMHGATGCPNSDVIAAGDSWLASNLPPIIQYANAHDGVIFIVWDEPEGGSPLIPFLAIGPHIKPGYASSVSVTHSALVKTVEKIFGLPLLPTVAAANDFGDLFQAGFYP